MNHTHCTSNRAQSVWQSLPDKARASVVGQSFAHIIALLGDDGYVPLSTVLAALYPDLPADQARSALSTQIVNRAYTSDSGQVPLRLCVSRKNKLSIVDQRVWFEGASSHLPTESALDTPRYEAGSFTGAMAQAITGKDINKELSQAPKKTNSQTPAPPLSEAALAASNQAQLSVDKAALNQGRPQAVHGLKELQSLGTGSSRRDAGTQDFVATTAASSLGFSSIGVTVTCLNGMLDWARDTSPKAPRLLALLGDYGAGKTSHAMQLERVLAGLVPPPTSAQGEGVETKQLHPKPAFIDLALLAGVDNLAYLSLPELLGVAINKRRSGSGAGHASIDAATLIAMARAGEVVMLYDGLDELLKHNDGYGLHNLLDQLLRVLEPDHATGKASKAKIMVSCRTHYFRDLQSQHAFFDTRRRGVAQANDYLCLSLLPWNAQTVESYLNKRLKPSDASELLRIIKTTYNLEELASKPLLLAMMSEQVNQLLAENSSGQPFTASRLYGITVAECLARDFGKHVLKPHHKPLIMGALATAMWNDNAEQWSANKLDAWLARAVPALFPNQYTTVDMGAMQDDLRTATFIVRSGGRGDDFNFSHRSFMEYFIARWIWDCTQNQHDGVFDEMAIRDYLPQRELNLESTQFARELWQAQYNDEVTKDIALRHTVYLWRWLQYSDAEGAEPAPLINRVIFDLIIQLSLVKKNIVFPAVNKYRELLDYHKTINLRKINSKNFHYEYSESGYPKTRMLVIWESFDFSKLPALDLQSSRFSWFRAINCNFGVMNCTDSNWEHAIFRDCELDGIVWGDASRANQIIRHGKRKTIIKPLKGPWLRPSLSDTEQIELSHHLAGKFGDVALVHKKIHQFIKTKNNGCFQHYVTDIFNRTSFATFDSNGNLLDYDDEAADTWLFCLASGRPEPVETAVPVD